MTTLTFDIRQGGGTEPLIGGVTLTPTRTNYNTGSVTLPQPQTIGLHAGKGTMLGVTPTPAGVAPAWAYTATIINGVTGERKSWLVTVPNQTTVAFDALPKPVEVVDPAVDVAALANSIDGATASVAVTSTGDVVVTRVDGGTYTAGNSRGPQGFPGVTDLATTTSPGLLSATDKAAIDSIAAKYVGKDPKVVNVKDYGAKGDGSADDTAAFAAAAASTSTTDADTLTIVVPPGEYLLSDRWRLRPNTTVSAYGATIHRSGSIGMIVVNWPSTAEGDTGTGKVGAYDGWSNITVLGLALDGHGDTNTATTNLVCFEHAKRITIRDLTCRRNVGYHGLELNAIDGFTVQNYRSEGFLPVAGQTEKEALQIDCAAPGNAGIADQTPCKNGVIEGVYIGPYGTLGSPQVAVGSHTKPTSGFHENIAVRGVVAESPLYAGVMAYGWSNCAISAPIIRTPGTFGVRVTECQDLTITAPTIVNAGTQCVSISANSQRIQLVGGNLTGSATAVYIGAGTNGCSAVGVTTNATTGPGITVDGTAANTNVQGNTILGAGSSTATTTLGAIRITGTASNTSVSGNKCVPHGNSAWFTVPAGISIGGTATGTWAAGNDLKGYPAATAGTVDTSTNRI